MDFRTHRFRLRAAADLIPFEARTASVEGCGAPNDRRNFLRMAMTIDF
jgi:hypothetical protein